MTTYQHATAEALRLLARRRKVKILDIAQQLGVNRVSGGLRASRAAPALDHV